MDGREKSLLANAGRNACSGQVQAEQASETKRGTKPGSANVFIGDADGSPSDPDAVGAWLPACQ